MMDLPVESHHAPGLAAAAQMLSNVKLSAALPGSLKLVLPADPSLAHLRCCMAARRVSQRKNTSLPQVVTSECLLHCDLDWHVNFENCGPRYKRRMWCYHLHCYLTLP